jgi:signal transduction histidine kinase
LVGGERSHRRLGSRCGHCRALSETGDPPVGRWHHGRDHRQALDELREVITALREDSDDHDWPQPAAGGLPRLIEESRSAGTQVAVQGAPELSGLPPMSARAAYRLVQEGLTNARKHAPGQPVTLTVSANGGDAALIEIRTVRQDLHLCRPVAAPASLA